MKRFASFVFYILCACTTTSKESSSSSEKKVQIFRACMDIEPFSLHPAYGFDDQSQLFIRALFEGLTRIGQDGKTYPSLAETVAISEDQKTYTFTLKEAYWTHGERVLASDFAYAWKSIIASDSDASLCDLFYIIKNAKLIKEKRLPLEALGIKVIDDKTLSIELEHPASYFLHLLANPIFSPVCQTIDQNFPDWHLQSGSAFVCNGPFKLAHRNNSRIIMTKNEFYHDTGSVKLNEVDIHFIGDPYTVLLMFEKNEIDWAGAPFEKLPLEAIPSLLAKKQLHLHPTAGVYWLVCHTEVYPLNSPNIRKAIAYAINRKEITENVFIGHKAAFSIAPDMLSCLGEEKKNQDQNLSLAKLFFQKGLEELGITEEQFPCLELSYAPSQKAVVESIQEQLRKILGIKVKLQGSEWNVCFHNFVKRRFQIGIVGWLSFVQDPTYHLNTFRQRSYPSNWCSWENNDYQKLLDLADFEVDKEVRHHYLQEAEEMLLREMPVIPLYYQVHKYIKQKNIHHAPLTDLGEFDLKWVSIE